MQRYQKDYVYCIKRHGKCQTSQQMSNKINNIVKQCASNCPKAQMDLYGLFSSRVYYSCYRILQNQMEAEEVMQDSFLKVFDKIEQYIDAPEKLEFSLRRIAINASIDTLRKRNVVFVDCDNIAEDEEEIIDNDQQYETEEMAQKAKAIIGSLPDGYRTILMLKLVEQIDNKEIAEQLGISELTVRSQFLRARNKVKTLLLIK